MNIVFLNQFSEFIFLTRPLEFINPKPANAHSKENDPQG